MNRTTIKKALQHQANGAEFITQNGVKVTMGWGNDRTIRTLKPLDFIRSGRTKQYLIDEVAERIFEDVERS